MSVINTNVNAMFAQESGRSAGLKQSQAMERLSTGVRINSAKDDAAGLAITNRMTSQVRGISMAVRNANDAISMSQTAEGAYGEVNSLLQRMRELAVQSSSGGLTASDRASTQLEVAQLVSEINHIASTTNHNNIKLLDGSASNIVIQTGANQADTITMGFDSVKANQIGAGIQPSLTSYGGTSASVGALSNGDLVLNGVNVGATNTEDDNVSTAFQSASAIAKVVAINRVSSQSGVIAKVAGTDVSGTSMTGAVVTAGSITINGYSTANFTTTADTSTSRKTAVAAINAISGATGVIATDTESDFGGVTLSAADGRNIAVSFTTATATSTGVTAGNFVGKYHLYSANGASTINVDTKEGNLASNINNAGLRIGNYSTSSATTATLVRASAAAATAPDNATTGVLNGTTLIINGKAIGAAVSTDDTASYTGATSSSRAASGIAIATAINRQSAVTGVTAKAEATVLRGTGFTAATSQTLMINGVSMTINTIDLQNVIDTVNENTGQTGVVASQYGSGLQLTAADGRNIAIGSDATATAGNFGLLGVTIGALATAAGSVTHYSTVSLQSDNAFTVDHGSEAVANFELLGFRKGTYGGAKGDKINEVDLSTQTGAVNALKAIDGAINQVSAAQAKSGAFNNRLDAIVDNLNEGLQNMSASRSRILDTDYATESTNLAKQQIITQAATAMLAQANQASQTVLALLK